MRGRDYKRMALGFGLQVVLFTMFLLLEPRWKSSDLDHVIVILFFAASFVTPYLIHAMALRETTFLTRWPPMIRGIGIGVASLVLVFACWALVFVFFVRARPVWPFD